LFLLGVYAFSALKNKRKRLVIAIAQAHAWPIPVLVNENHAGCFECPAYDIERCMLRLRTASLEVADCSISNFRRVCQLLLRPVK
jgi:hypothetical protein